MTSSTLIEIRIWILVSGVFEELQGSKRRDDEGQPSRDSDGRPREGQNRGSSY